MYPDGVTPGHALELFQMGIPLHRSTQVHTDGAHYRPSRLPSYGRSDDAVEGINYQRPS